MFRAGIGLVLLVFLLGFTACNGQAESTADVSGSDVPSKGNAIEPMMIESVELEILESFPVQIRALVTGALIDGCTEIEFLQRTDLQGNTLYLDITTDCPPDVAAADQRTTFVESFPLDVEGLPAGTYSVEVDGVSATFALDVDNVFPVEPGGANLPMTTAVIIGISLMPYATKGFHGVVPEGWTEKRPGEFSRDQTDTDQTFLVQQEVPGATAELVMELLAPRLGIEVLPNPSGAFRNEHLSWELYAIDRTEPDAGQIGIDIALAEDAGRVYLVLMGAAVEEYDDLHYVVFLRVVDALVPLTTHAVEKSSHEPEEATDAAQAEVLLLKGEQLENDASDTVARLLQSELGLSTAFVNLDALENVDLQDVKLIFFPGGDCAAVHLSGRAARRVREAVAAGTGYIGTCCGAFLAAEATTTASHIHLPANGGSFGIFPGTAEWGGGEGHWPFHINVDHPIVTDSSVSDRISPLMQMRFVGGTSNLVPSYAEGLQNWRVATIDAPADGKPGSTRAAMTATLFGKGRVFLSGAHPEAQASTYPLILAAAEWCVAASDPESDQLPVIAADIPAQGIAGRFVAASATGSRDPLGHPIGFIWDFGDGAPRQHRPEAVHIYEKPGTYTITLTVTTGTRYSTRSMEVEIHEP